MRRIKSGTLSSRQTILLESQKIAYNSPLGMTSVSSIKSKPVGGPKGGFSLPYSAALNLILEAEAGSRFTEHQKAELPAIVSHWLQSPEAPPTLLDASFGKKWRKVLSCGGRYESGVILPV